MNKSVVVDIAGGSWSESANVQVYGGNGTTAQKFRVSHDEKGYVVLEAVVSGRVLDVAGGTAKAGVNVQQYSKNGTRAQKWVAVKRGDGIELVSALSFDGSWLVLDVSGGKAVNGTNVQVWGANNTPAQRWIFASSPLISPGVYSVYSMVAGKGARVLDVSGGSVSSGANIWSYASNGTIAQNFYISAPDKGGAVSLQSLASGLFVGVNSSGNVIQTSNGSASSQRWKVQSQPDGSFAFVNVATGKLLDVHDGSAASGANVKVWQSNGSNAQKWRLIEQPAPLPNGWYSLHSKSDYNKVIDVANGSKSKGGNVWLYQSNGTLAQKWYASRNSDGTYTFTAANSGLAMDVAGGRMVNGANIQQYTKWSASDTKNNKAQRFYVTWDPKFGGFKIAAKGNSNLSLSLANEKTANKTNVILWQDHNVTGERFTFKLENKPAKIFLQNQAERDMAYLAQRYSSSTNWLILVNNSTSRVGVFQRVNQQWVMRQYWVAAPGSDRTPTVKGQFTVSNRGYSFGSGYTCYYWVQFYGDYLFHSVLYNQGTMTIQDGRLGQRVSHGCVRLAIENAKWIYDNIPRGTKVVSY